MVSMAQGLIQLGLGEEGGGGGGGGGKSKGWLATHPSFSLNIFVVRLMNSIWTRAMHSYTLLTNTKQKLSNVTSTL